MKVGLILYNLKSAFKIQSVLYVVFNQKYKNAWKSFKIVFTHFLFLRYIICNSVG